jgi:hypothetical protein
MELRILTAEKVSETPDRPLCTLSAIAGKLKV